jgi:myo-inositol 2-dehydrogenase/D-chiro-inositol 1-dehydrogenase
VSGVDGLIASGVDVVDVCTPPQAHADATIQALESGLHVICEKPLARTMDDARRILKAAESASGILCVGQVARYEPDHAAAKALVDEGRIGRLRMVTHSTTTSLPGWSESGWLADAAKSGGPLLDQAVHQFDYFGWLTGCAAVRVHTVAGNSGIGPTTYALATVRYSDDTVAHAEVSWAHPPARGFRLSAELVGTEGRLSWNDEQLVGGVLYPRYGGREAYDVLGERGFWRELRDFTDAIRSGGDADLCFRLAVAGWEMEERPRAVVDHRSRRALLDLLGQRARHGSGAEWLEMRHGRFIGPRRRWRGIVKDMVVGSVRALGALARSDTDQAVLRLVDPLSEAAFEVGRRIPNLPWREQTVRDRVVTLAGRRASPRP